MRRVAFALALALALRWAAPPAAADEPLTVDVRGAPPARVLFPILERGRWGFIDSTGRVAIPARYDGTITVETERRLGESMSGRSRPQPADLFMASHVGPESTWAIGVELRGKWGLATQRGAKVGDPRYDDMEAYGEGYAAVRLDGRWGFVDALGQLVITPQFEEVRPFRGGLGLARVAGLWGAIDGRGRFVLAPRFQFITPGDSVFHDDRALVTMDDKKGFVRRAGNVVIPPAYDEALPFSEGLAAVAKEGHWGYVDTLGHLVIAARFDAADPFDRGWARVMVGDRYGLIDRRGEFVVKPEYDDLAEFAGGERAPARRNGRTGWLDRNGRFTASAYEEWLVIDDSLAVGRIGPRVGVVRRGSNAFVRAYPWDEVGRFSGGFAAVRMDGKRFGFIDPQGTLAIPERFDEVGRFVHGLCKVAAGDTLGYVDRSGAWVWSGVFPGYRKRNLDRGQ